MPSSGMLRRVPLIGTEFRSMHRLHYQGNKIGELGATLVVTSNRRMMRRNTNIAEDGITNSHCVKTANVTLNF
jgi:hypothetical protein